jgi:hypothetical protein
MRAEQRKIGARALAEQCYKEQQGKDEAHHPRLLSAAARGC